MMLNRLIRAFGIALIAACCGAALAQSYPSKPIRMVIPVPPGSGLEYVGRFAVDRMSQNMGQPIIVENFPGANGNIAAAALARGTPDGYAMTIWGENVAYTALIYGNLNFDPMMDIQLFGTIAKARFVLSVHPGFPAQTLEELVKLARSKPGSIAFGTSGNGSPHHLVSEMFAQAAGIQLLHVPYSILKGHGQIEDMDRKLSTYKMFWLEDYTVQVGQKPISDDREEHLGRMDAGVILVRKLWRQELQALADGRTLASCTSNVGAGETSKEMA